MPDRSYLTKVEVIQAARRRVLALAAEAELEDAVTRHPAGNKLCEHCGDPVVDWSKRQLCEPCERQTDREEEAASLAKAERDMW